MIQLIPFNNYRQSTQGLNSIRFNLLVNKIDKLLILGGAQSAKLVIYDHHTAKLELIIYLKDTKVTITSSDTSDIIDNLSDIYKEIKHRMNCKVSTRTEPVIFFHNHIQNQF